MLRALVSKWAPPGTDVLAIPEKRFARSVSEFDGLLQDEDAVGLVVP